MAVDFPTSPTVNQVYTSGSRSWQWTGSAWQAINSATPAFIGTANTFTASPQQITIATAANVGAIIKGAASQSGDLQQWQNSSGTVLAKVTSAGTFQAVIIDGGSP